MSDLRALCLLGLASTAQAAMGGAFSTGPVDDGNFIREGYSTLVLPGTPDPAVGDLSLWVGMGTSDGDLVQAITENIPKYGGTDACGNLNEDEWCTYTYTLTSDHQVPQGTHKLVKKGDEITSHYVYNDETEKYDQFVYHNGQLLSKLSTDSGKALGFGTAEECAGEPCGVVPQHQWINTTIILDKAYPDYISTRGVNLASASAFETADGGKTWHVDTITINQWNNTYL